MTSLNGLDRTDGLKIIIFRSQNSVSAAPLQGKHVARNSLSIDIARYLWASDIGHAIEDGKEVPIEYIWPCLKASIQSFF